MQTLQPAPGACTRPPHVPALDGVRGLAICLVLVTHGFGAGLVPLTGGERVLSALTNWGWLGVDLFFVLSGYLITGILLATRDEAHYLRNFFARRALRILPLYYATVLVCLVVLPLAAAAPRFDWLRDLSSQQSWFWLHLSNYYKITCDNPPVYWLSCLWSLAVEEHFYLIWPFVVWKLSDRRLLQLCAALGVAILGLRVVLALAGFTGDYLYRSTLTRSDPLLLGAVLAILARRPDGLSRLAGWARLGVAAGLVALLAQMATHAGADGRRSTFYGMTAQYSVVALLCTGLLVLVLTSARRGPLRRLFTLTPLLTLGKYSYALYILNKPAYALLREFFEPGQWPIAGSSVPAACAFALAGALLALLGARVTWVLLERPCLSLKRYFEGPPRENTYPPARLAVAAAPASLRKAA